MRYFIILILLFPAHDIIAQIDTSYIGTFERELALQAYVSRKFTTLSYQPAMDDPESDFKPNNVTKFGAGAMWKAFALYLGYGFKDPDDQDKGKTKSFDFQFHYYGQRILLDIFVQNYAGFYIETPEGSGQYVIRPDLKISQYGIFGQYIFNKKKFSYSAAFNQDLWQKKSVGSFQTGLGVYYSHTVADSAFLVQEDEEINRIHNIQFGPSVGYAYTFVFARHAFITMSLSVGVHVGFTEINDRDSKVVKPYPTMYPRVAMGYNAERWAICITAASNKTPTLVNGESMLSINTGTFQLIFSKRFHFQPKLPKVFDIITR